MQIANQAATEIIVVDDLLYMRSSGGKWTDLSGTEAAKVVGSSSKFALRRLERREDRRGSGCGRENARRCTALRSVQSASSIYGRLAGGS